MGSGLDHYGVKWRGYIAFGNQCSRLTKAVMQHGRQDLGDTLLEEGTKGKECPIGIASVVRAFQELIALRIQSKRFYLAFSVDLQAEVLGEGFQSIMRGKNQG